MIARATVDDKTGEVIGLSGTVPFHTNIIISKNKRTIEQEIKNKILAYIKNQTVDPSAKENFLKQMQKIEDDKKFTEENQRKMNETNEKIIQKNNEEKARALNAKVIQEARNIARREIGHNKAQTYKGKNTKNSGE